MISVDSALTDMMSAVFADYREGHDSPTVCDAAFWNRLNELGLIRLTGDEARGGSGASWLEAAELLRTATYHGVRVPLAEHDLLACWLLDQVGLEVDDARRTACVLDGTGTATDVPWASWSDRVVVAWRQGSSTRVADVDGRDLHIVPGTNIAGEPRDRVSVDVARLSGDVAPDTLIDTLFLRGALARSVQICASFDRILELAVEHTRDRVQFGRPLMRFQAIQHLVADIAAETALARATTESAVAEVVRSGWDDPRIAFRIAVARSCTGHAASVVVRNAHQVHGAIGTTREHRLHEFTTGALAWRSDFGSVYHWDNLLTGTAMAAGPHRLWAYMSS
ncbi:acyl-CoA dehydrogenase family protein [Nocardia jiangxiensis]|uniref:Acyl-CoA dehydrogenase family protein n=1 Tax=Nocardia jiangxiensis TaxID=282685 RepID=A0ABW6SGQ1_9NOCA